MPTNYLQVFISAENKKQADKILSSLLIKKLVAGGLLIKGPAKFWWKGEIVGMNYYNVSAFTLKKNKQSIIADVKKVSIEEIPMVWFVKIDGNSEFLEWIRSNVVK